MGDMWTGLVDWVGRSMLDFDPQLASPEDVSIPTCVASADEAVAVIAKRHSAWVEAQA